jgi:hypothetical protein
MKQPSLPKNLQNLYKGLSYGTAVHIFSVQTNSLCFVSYAGFIMLLWNGLAYQNISKISIKDWVMCNNISYIFFEQNCLLCFVSYDVLICCYELVYLTNFFPKFYNGINYGHSVIIFCIKLFNLFYELRSF